MNALGALPGLTRLSYEEVGAGFSKLAAEDFWLGYEHGGITAETVSILSDKSIRAPQDSFLAMKVAALQAWFGQDSAYAATCERVITAAERDYNSEPKERAAKNWCLQASADVAMLQRVLALAREVARIEVHAERYPWCQQTLGMAEFRARNDNSAEAAFRSAEKATDNWLPEPRHFILGPSRFFRAMMLFRKGEMEEAKRLFSEAEAQMPPIPENADHELPWGCNQDHLLYWLTYKEAKAQLKIGTPTKP